MRLCIFFKAQSVTQFLQTHCALAYFPWIRCNSSGKRKTATTHTNARITRGATTGMLCCRCVAMAPPMYPVNNNVPNTPVRGITNRITEINSTMPSVANRLLLMPKLSAICTVSAEPMSLPEALPTKIMATNPVSVQ